MFYFLCLQFFLKHNFGFFVFFCWGFFCVCIWVSLFWLYRICGWAVAFVGKCFLLEVITREEGTQKLKFFIVSHWPLQLDSWSSVRDRSERSSLWCRVLTWCALTLVVQRLEPVTDTMKVGSSGFSSRLGRAVRSVYRTGYLSAI